MKKKLSLILGLIAIAIFSVAIFKSGNRGITIYVDGNPASPQVLRRGLNSETITLDDSGSACLPCGFKESTPQFLFPNAIGGSWVLTLPEKGHRTYQISGINIVTETVIDYGILKIRNRNDQRTLDDEEMQNK